MTHTQMLEQERAFMMDATAKMLESLATMASMEAADFVKHGQSELVNVAGLETMMAGISVAVVKIGTISHVMKMMRERVLDTAPAPRRK